MKRHRLVFKSRLPSLPVVVEPVQERLTSTDSDHRFSNHKVWKEPDQAALVVRQLALVSVLPALEVAPESASVMSPLALKLLQGWSRSSLELKLSLVPKCSQPSGAASLKRPETET